MLTERIYTYSECSLRLAGVALIEYSNLVIKTSEGVYEPAEDTFLTAEFVERAVESFGKDRIDIVDIGTGTGLLGLVAASKDNVNSVMLADVDKNAVELAEYNYVANKHALLAECSFIYSDLFSNIVRHFDLIIFNAPYLRHEKNTEGETSKQWDGGKEGIEISIRFLEQAKEHLNEGGCIVLVASSLSNLRMLEKKIKGMDMRIVDRGTAHAFFEDIVVMLIRA